MTVSEENAPLPKEEKAPALSCLRKLGPKIKNIARENRIFTSGQASRIIGVAPRTVSKWFDLGFFPNAFRVVSKFDTTTAQTTGDRRIPRQDLIDFCRTRKMVQPLIEMGELDPPAPGPVPLRQDPTFAANGLLLLSCGLSVGGPVAGYETVEVHDIIQATTIILLRRPRAFIIDRVIGQTHVRSLVQLMTTSKPDKTMPPIFVRIYDGDEIDTQIQQDNCVQAELFQLPAWLAALSAG